MVETSFKICNLFWSLRVNLSGRTRTDAWSRGRRGTRAVGSVTLPPLVLKFSFLLRKIGRVRPLGEAF